MRPIFRCGMESVWIFKFWKTIFFRNFRVVPNNFRIQKNIFNVIVVELVVILNVVIITGIYHLLLLNLLLFSVRLVSLLAFCSRCLQKLLKAFNFLPDGSWAFPTIFTTILTDNWMISSGSSGRYASDISLH